MYRKPLPELEPLKPKLTAEGIKELILSSVAPSNLENAQEIVRLLGENREINVKLRATGIPQIEHLELLRKLYANRDLVVKLRQQKVIPSVSTRKNQHEESDFQIVCYRWFCAQYPKLKELLWGSINGVKLNLSPRQLAKLKEMGFTKGVPDFTLSAPRGNFAGLFVELKVQGRKPSKEQRAMLKRLDEEGYCCKVANNIDEFISVITTYLSAPNPFKR